MATPYRTLEVDALREVVAHELFAWGPAGGESFALTLEALPVAWRARAKPTSWARTIGPPPRVPSGRELRTAVSAAAEAAGERMHVAGIWEPGPAEGAWVELGPGGQVRVHSGWAGTPAHSAALATGLFDTLRAALEREGIGLVCMGHDPWHAPDSRAGADESVWAACQEQVFDSVGGRGLQALRTTAGASVHLAFGGPVKGPRRWRAAWLLAPRLAAMFAHSPLEEGVSSRCRSARARAWLHAEPSRCGYLKPMREQPDLAPPDQYLQFALAARVLWVVRDGQVHAQKRPLSFAHWMAVGVDGCFPELEDWRAHLTTLRPLVRPEGALTLEAMDGQGRAFAALPLLVASTLLVDDAAIEEVFSCLGESPAELDELHESGMLDGLLDQRLAGEGRRLLAVAADALLRAPRGWASPTLVAALVAFERDFTRQGRTPADELLEVFLERGALDRDDLEGLEERWCAAVGMPVSWRSGARSA